jgi:SAM-dependent methyltransferase
MPLPSVYVFFPSRESRSRFVCARFAEYLNERVLDIGCFEAPLRDLLSSATYTGVDIAGHPDISLDLERIERLPFDDGTFKCVLCIDVLEHLDNLHVIFDELVRVSKQYVIVSLPNCWGGARRPIGRGRGRFGHYGLSLQKPQDRHKWFFSLSEARQFVEGKAEELGLRLKDMFVTEKPRINLVRLLRRIRYPGDRYHNRYSHTLWAVLEKMHPNSSIELGAAADGCQRPLVLTSP